MDVKDLVASVFGLRKVDELSIFSLHFSNSLRFIDLVAGSSFLQIRLTDNFNHWRIL